MKTLIKAMQLIPRAKKIVAAARSRASSPMLGAEWRCRFEMEAKEAKSLAAKVAAAVAVARKAARAEPGDAGSVHIVCAAGEAVGEAAFLVTAWEEAEAAMAKAKAAAG